MTTQKPKKLEKGDTIGVFTASDPLAPPVSEYVAAGIAQLKELGFNVIEGNTLTGQHFYTTGTPEERWADLRSIIENDDVTMIITAMGGESAHEILPLMDFDLIANKPKIYMGMSDPTVLWNPISDRTGIPTFYGFHAASFDPNWQWFSDEYDLAHFRRIVMAEESAPHVIEPYAQRETWRSGRAEGTLRGGCLGDLVKLLGTPYEPNWDDAILMLEHVGRTPQQLAVDLEHLKQVGVFEKVRGLLLGKFYECRDDEHPDQNMPIRDLFLEKLNTYDLPILKTEDFGHFSHMAPLPIGGTIALDAENKIVEIIDPPVRS